MNKKEVICFVCKVRKPREETVGTWVMQVLHFLENEVNVLTCDQCKDLSPFDILQKLNEEFSNDKTGPYAH